MNKVLIEKLGVLVGVNDLVPNESMHTSEIHEGTNPLNNVSKIIVVDRNGVVHEHLVMQKDVQASYKCDLQSIMGAQEGIKEVLGLMDVLDNVNMPPITTIQNNQLEKARLIMLTYCTIIYMN
jgi:hypothetical protein